MPPGRASVVVPVEIVHTPATRQRGLMFRDTLPSDAGMLFLFEEERQQRFWMRNTNIPLDMIFIRTDRSILGIVENAEPHTDDSRFVPGPSQYVLEVNAGFARKYGIEAGMMVRFEGMDTLLTRR